MFFLYNYICNIKDLSMKLQAYIEMTANTMGKYELDKTTGKLVLDRYLNVKVPYNYGFIQGTLAPDGDALDVFVLGHPMYPATVLDVVLVGGFKCIDNGEQDDKLLAIPSFFGSLEYSEFTKAEEAVYTYLTTYKKGFEVVESLSPFEAMKVYYSTAVGE